MNLIVDTNILIDFSRRARQKTETTLWTRLVYYAKREAHPLIFPSIAVFELFAGEEMESARIQEIADNMLRDVIVLDLAVEVSREAARLFRKHQIPIGPIDYILAATAIILEGELVTLNTRHFSVFKDLHLFDTAKLSGMKLPV